MLSVLPIGTMEEHVVLGHTWCYLTSSQIDWHKQQAKMVYKGHATQVPLLQEGTSMQSPMQMIQLLRRVKVKRFSLKTPHPQKPLYLQVLPLQPPQNNLIIHNLANGLHLVHAT